jgi:type I restriction enzyme S subunit
MSEIENLITEKLDIWTGAVKPKSSAGRGRGKASKRRFELYGINKLRELILELAVRGLLVPQDARDEPATSLLEKISKERGFLVQEKRIRKFKKLPAIGEDEEFMPLPNGWLFTRLNDIGEWGAGSTPSRRNSEYYGGDIPWFKSGELRHDYISDSEETVTELALKQASLRSNSVGDVLLAMYGATIGKASILSVAATTNQAVCACTPFTGLANTFLLMLLKAYRPRFIGMGAGGAQPNISREKIIATVIALPPSAEQKRIVAKVDELMALCDQLEQQTEASLTAHQTLVETLLSALTNAADSNAFNDAWQRIAQHFDTLFTTEHSIDQLKQTILQLAVMGKLVSQSTHDEPASELLKKIATENANLVKNGEVKKLKKLVPIDDNEKFFDLPQGWEWVRVGSISNLKGGFAYKSKEFVAESSHQIIRMGNIRPDFLRIDSNAVFITPEYASDTQEYQIRERDILLTMTGTKGKRDYLYSVLIKKTDMGIRALYLNQRLCALRLNGVNEKYMIKVLKDNRMLDAIYAKSTGSANQANIGMGAIANWIIPLPPEQEQDRIVNKVEKLMLLCDQLKLRLSEAQTAKLLLADSIVKQPIN